MRFSSIFGLALVGSVAAKLSTFTDSFTAIEKISLDLSLSCKSWNGTHTDALPILAHIHKFIEIVTTDTGSIMGSSNLAIAESFLVSGQIPSVVDKFTTALEVCTLKIKFFFELLLGPVVIISFGELKLQFLLYNLAVVSKMPLLQQPVTKNALLSPIDLKLGSTIKTWENYKAKRSSEEPIKATRAGRRSRLAKRNANKEAEVEAVKPLEIEARIVEPEVANVAEGQRARRVRKAKHEAVRWQ